MYTIQCLSLVWSWLKCSHECIVQCLILQPITSYTCLTTAANHWLLFITDYDVSALSLWFIHSSGITVTSWTTVVQVISSLQNLLAAVSVHEYSFRYMFNSARRNVREMYCFKMSMTTTMSARLTCLFIQFIKVTSHNRGAMIGQAQYYTGCDTDIRHCKCTEVNLYLCVSLVFYSCSACILVIGDADEGRVLCA